MIIATAHPPCIWGYRPPNRNSWVAACPGCATCDGFFYKGQEVAVIGGGNTAVEEALYLSNIASHVTIVHRRDKFRAEPILVDQAQERVDNGKAYASNGIIVDEMLGDNNGVTGVRVKTSKPARQGQAGAFIAIGHKPNTGTFTGQLTMANGYIITKAAGRGCHRNQRARRVRGGRCAGPRLPPGGDQRRQRCMVLDAERYLQGLRSHQKNVGQGQIR